MFVRAAYVMVSDRCQLARTRRRFIRRIVIDIGIDIEGDIDIVSLQALDETQRDGSERFLALQSAQAS
jgi:hypothetical protein